MNTRCSVSYSSEAVAEDADVRDAHEDPEGRDEAPIELPEEGGSRSRDDGLRGAAAAAHRRA